MLVKIYGCFFPRDLVLSHFINLYLTMVFQYLESNGWFQISALEAGVDIKCKL